MSRGLRVCSAAILVALGLPLPPANAADGTSGVPTTERPPEKPSREVWAGVIGGSTIWSAYSGVTYAPFGSVQEDGFRFRSVGGYGQYRYSYVSGTTSLGFRGTGIFTDLLVGYQLTLGPATLKVLAGGSAIGHILSEYDRLNRVQGLDFGPKIGLESWWNLGDKAFQQLDSSWTAAFGSVDIRSRTGFRISNDFSAGIELAASSNTQLKSEWSEGKPWRGASGGAFVRYEWEAGEVSASAGLGSLGAGASGAPAGVTLAPSLGSLARPSAPYASLNWLTRF